ncbi:MAG TPA: alpha/beta fold hydrolase [Vulgatibacter sp.]|nr:alpha/beta fold hydrolase [Vulgatibacter sp.]
MRSARSVLVAFMGIGVLAFAALIGRGAMRSDQQFHVGRDRPERPKDLCPPGESCPIEDARFRTSDGLQLFGWFVPPRLGKTVLLAHGLGQGRLGLLPEARYLVRAGYGVLLFDLRGHGESEGSTVTMGEKEQLDIEAAADWLRRRPEVDRERLGAIGFSIGANALAHAAARDRGLRAVVLLSPGTSLRENLELDFPSHGLPSWLGALLPYYLRGIDLDAVRPVDVLGAIAPRRVLLIAGSEDEGQWMIPLLEQALPPGSRTWLVPGAGHGGFDQAAPDEYEKILVGFLDAEL